MKKILTIAASLAMVVGLASCQKDKIIENGGNGDNGDNVKKGGITATFANPSTKVTYTEIEYESTHQWNLRPVWEIGDIIVGITSNDTSFEFEVKDINDGVAVLESNTGTIPEGDVTLFYKKGLKGTGTGNDWDDTDKQFVVNLNSQKGDDTMPAIMYATGTIDNGNAQFEFNNAGAVLGISAVGNALKGESIKQVTLYGRNLASSATLDKTNKVTFIDSNEGYNVISTGILSNITVKEDGTLNNGENPDKPMPILMAVPLGATIDSVFIRTCNDEIYSLGSTNKNPIAANEYRYIKEDATFKRDKYRDDMILTGVYSVDANKQVFFSKGNLYYDGTNWGFEAEQHYFRTYSAKGKCDANGYNKSSGTANGHYGLFGWVGESTPRIKYSEIHGVLTSTTGSNHYGKQSNEALKEDWGKIIDNNGTWRTLSGGDNGEWKYLFDNHINVWGICNNVPGRFIAPDGFMGDASALSKAIENWASAQSAGIVFLPASGRRSGTNVDNVGEFGYCWSSSSSATKSANAYRVLFNKSTVEPGNSEDARYYGYSVRLITESK